MTGDDDNPQGLVQLLPFYATGNLGAEDRARVEAALAVDASLRQELEAVQALRRMVREGATGLAREPRDAELRLRRLLARLGPPGPRVLGAQPERPTSRGVAWKVAFAASTAVVVAQGAIIAWQAAGPHRSYETLAGPAASRTSADLLVTPAADARWGDVQALLARRRLEIVGGPPRRRARRRRPRRRLARGGGRSAPRLAAGGLRRRRQMSLGRTAIAALAACLLPGAMIAAQHPDVAPPPGKVAPTVPPAARDEPTAPAPPSSRSPPHKTPLTPVAPPPVHRPAPANPPPRVEGPPLAPAPRAPPMRDAALPQESPGVVLFLLRETADPRTAAKGAGVELAETTALTAIGLRLAVGRLPPGDTPAEAVRRLERRPEVAWAQADHRYQSLSASAPPAAFVLHGLDAAQPATGVVAMIDTMAAGDHEAFRGAALQQRFFRSPVAPAAHGTAVASLIVGRAGARGPRAAPGWSTWWPSSRSPRTGRRYRRPAIWRGRSTRRSRCSRTS
ncbi:hypothetical protein [Phenylobacterium sp. J367]|uniref:hypothetical protein n=1 Tax=Phenylobacterium sp. J367 TaxID=2898435 RepID=UPI002151D912|nr:hypothetical protein [Phenylobacterium sp. J367]MCR5879652.1 hypothetical protein [Phenylobacterium sp. J367]